MGIETRQRAHPALLEGIAGLHSDVDLPRFHGDTFVKRAQRGAPPVQNAPAAGRKAVLYATCFVNYNNPGIGEAARAVLAHNGIETEVVYPECCGMPQLEQGDIGDVARRARHVAAELAPWIDKRYTIVALTPSCALMLKFEWPLILPGDAVITRLAEACADISEYIVDIAKTEGLAPGLSPLPGGVALHLVCHARAQNMGPKAADMLRLIPDTDVAVTERCSGHGGSWGVKREHFDVALRVGKPVARTMAQAGKAHVASECPLAAKHIVQGMAALADQGMEAAADKGIEAVAGKGMEEAANKGIEAVADRPPHRAPRHPVELLALSYGLISGNGDAL